jgi:hypothetical protein
MDVSSPPNARPTLALLFAQSRILKALAGGTVLHGTAEELVRRLEVGPEAFRLALRDLVAGGWIFVSDAPDGQLIVGRERRSRDVGPPGPSDRRGPSSLWEGSTPFLHS